MGITVQQDSALKAANSLSTRNFSTVGNPDKKKVRVFRAPKGRHLAVILTNQTITAMTEAVHTIDSPTSRFHVRRYASDKSRNSNLNFAGSRLAVGNEVDCWAFSSKADFDEFVAWYEQKAT